MKCTEFLHLPCILMYPSCGLRVPGWGNCRPRGSCCSNTTRCNYTPWLSHWKGLWIAGILFKTKQRSMIIVLLTAQDKATQRSRQVKIPQQDRSCRESMYMHVSFFQPKRSLPLLLGEPLKLVHFWSVLIPALQQVSLPAPLLVSPCFTQRPCFHEALCWGLSHRILYKPHFSMRELYQLYCTDE